MFAVSCNRTMKNARPKLEVASQEIVRTVDQMRAEKRIEQERIRREQARAWVQRMEERHRAETARHIAENAPEYVPPEDMPPPPKKMPAQQIIASVAATHNIPIDAIMSPRRDRQAVAARFDAIVAVRQEHPHLSLTQLGRIFRKDHTSILNCLRVMEARKARLEAGGVS